MCVYLNVYLCAYLCAYLSDIRRDSAVAVWLRTTACAAKMILEPELQSFHLFYRHFVHRFFRLFFVRCVVEHEICCLCSVRLFCLQCVCASVAKEADLCCLQCHLSSLL